MRSLPKLGAVVLSAGICLTLRAQPIIVTAAGTDLVFRGDGQPAVKVSLGRISRIAVDPNGRPVFADPNYHLIFRLEADGSIRAIAGNNVQGLSSAPQSGLGKSGGGYSGDSGPATAAALNWPSGVAYDSAGNLYIADTFNQRIRMVNPQGVITTFAGNGQAGFRGDGQPALSASFNDPIDVVVDTSGNVYVNDSANFRIRKINSQGIVSTFAGTGIQGTAGESVAAASSPIGQVEGMALDGQGNLYFAEFSSNRVRRISSGVVTTVAGNGAAGSTGDGPALGVSLDSPGGVAFDRKGNLLISDTGNLRIRKLAGGMLTTIAGNGKAGFSGDGGSASEASVHNPFGLAVPPTGEIYFADRDNFRIRRIDAQGGISTATGDGRLIAAQNGVPASLATLLDPFGVSADSSGALLVADTDNNILRRINPDGTMVTFAGTGAQESSGDNGPAVQAGLLGPFSVTSDSMGNLFEAEAGSDSVRKIGASGSISSTIASGLSVPTQAVSDASGNVYIADFGSGRVLRRAPDGSTSTFVTGLFNPGGLALDSLGNLYVTEYGGGRVRRVSPTRTVTTIAGGGNVAGTAADGGPATNAKLGRPSGVTVDNAGNVYFTDVSSANVRKVATDGTISTIAGNGAPGYSGDGGPATGASLNRPWGVALDRSGSLYIADVSNNRIRKILLNSSPSFALDQTSLSLSAHSNSAPAGPVTVAVMGSLAGLLYSASADQPWLQVSPAGGAIPSAMQITADPAGIAPGTYSGKITVTAPGANPPIRTVAVTFEVTSASPGKLAVSNQSLAFSLITGADSSSTQLGVSNQGSGLIGFAASTTTTTGGDWLQVSPASGNVTASASSSVNVTATTGNRSAGTYSGSATVASADTGERITVPVTMTINESPKKIVLSQTGLTFVAVARGGTTLPQSFGILNAGGGSMGWSAQASTLAFDSARMEFQPGGSWLSIDQAVGTVATPFTDVSPVNVSVNAAGLDAGEYYGQIQVTAPGAPNSPQSVSVVLRVLPLGSNPGPEVRPTGLVFIGQAGSSPGSQNLLVANPTDTALTFGSTRSTNSGGNWFVHVPTGATVQPNAPERIIVQPDYTNLTAGQSYQGSLSLSFQDGTSKVISILLIVTSGASAGASAKLSERAVGCSPGFKVQPTAPDPSSSVTVGQPVSLQTRVVDNCGGSLTPGSVTATFSNGDPAVNLVNVGNGNWSGTWTPRGGTQTRVTVQYDALAVRGITVLGGVAKVSVPLVPGALPPLTLGAANAASGVGTYISPGGLVSIYGQQLAITPGGGGDVPFPTQLNGTRVLMGDKPLRLRYVGGGQVNAQVPFELGINTQQQLVVQRGATLSVPQDVVVAAAQPAVYTQDQSGSGPGVIVNGVTNALITAASPAKIGEVIVIYCNGLGAVDPALPSGTPAPPNGPLSHTKNPLTVTIGGVTARVDFAGLAPGYPDLYQVNALVPAGVTPGDQVPVVLSIAGQTSPPVTIAVR